MVNHVVPRAELESFGMAMAERIAQKPLFALRLAKQAVKAAQDAQGCVSAMQTSFALHHLAHAHNMIVHGKLVDPDGLMPSIRKHQKAADWVSAAWRPAIGAAILRRATEPEATP